MTGLLWLVTWLVALGIAEIFVPGDTTLRLYIGIFFLGGSARGILNTLWSKEDG